MIAVVIIFFLAIGLIWMCGGFRGNPGDERLENFKSTCLYLTLIFFVVFPAGLLFLITVGCWLIAVAGHNTDVYNFLTNNPFGWFMNVVSIMVFGKLAIMDYRSAD